MSAFHRMRLNIAADQVDDAEAFRIATQNRLRALTETKHMDGTVESALLEEQLEYADKLERLAVLELKRAMRAHPLWEWASGQIGVGEKTLGRLLGCIGDPAHRYDPETGELRPRTLSQLRSYCGYGDAAKQRRRKGVKSNWNADARSRLRLLAENCMKQRRSPYRPVYDKARAKYASRDTTDLHKHHMALRAISKAFLKDLHAEAVRVQNDTEGGVSA